MEDSTQNMDDGNLDNQEVNGNAMDDAIDTLYDKAIESGALAPAFDEYDDEEVSTQDVDENAEELEDEIDVVDEDAEDVGEEEDDTPEGEVETEDDESLPEVEAEDEGELDMEYMVPVKVDGEASEVSMEELIKGYQTSQHQTKKGQELAEQAKELKALESDGNLFMKMNEELLGQQDERDLALLNSRKDIMDRVAAGEFIDGVEDDLATLQYKYKGLEDEYNKRKADRSVMSDKMTEKAQEEYQKAVTEQVEHFQKEITNIVPDWSDEVAQENYKFAVEQGLPEQLVATITDPKIAKFIDEFRRLKTSASKGAVKRKKAPVKKVPTKKAVPKDMKKKSESAGARKRLSKGKGSERDRQTLADEVYDDIFDSPLF